MPVDDTKPKIEIRLRDKNHAVSLFLALSRFGGHQALASKGNIEPPMYIVELYEYPNDSHELEELLNDISLWLDTVGLEEVSVESQGHT